MKTIELLRDGLNERRFFDDEAIGELDEHFGSAGFGRMDAAGGPVDRLRGLDNFAGLRLRCFARIGEGGEHAFVLIED